MKDQIEYISTKEALNLMVEAGKSITLPTLISWVNKYELGNKLGGRWQVDKGKLIKFIEGN